MRKDVEAYLREIERGLFTCPRRKRAAFLSDFRGCLNSYLEEHRMATVEEMQAFFGTPEAIAEAFPQSDEFNTTKQVVSSRRRIVQIVLIAICALAAAAVILGTVYVVNAYQYTHGFWVEEPAQEGYFIPNPDALEIH